MKILKMGRVEDIDRREVSEKSFRSSKLTGLSMDRYNQKLPFGTS